MKKRDGRICVRHASRFPAYTGENRPYTSRLAASFAADSSPLPSMISMRKR